MIQYFYCINKIHLITTINVTFSMPVSSIGVTKTEKHTNIISKCETQTLIFNVCYSLLSRLADL